MGSEMDGKYVLRDISYIRYSDLESDPLHIQSVVFESKKGLVDIGAYCYIKRLKMKSHNKRCEVVIESLDESRISFVSSIFESIRLESIPSQKYIAITRGYFIDFIDNNDISTDFEDYDSVISAYKKYSDHLAFRVSLNNRIGSSKLVCKPLTHGYAKQCQSSAVAAISIYFKRSELEVYNACSIRIHDSIKAREGRRRAKVKVEEDINYSIKCLVNFVEVSHEFLTNRSSLPIAFISPDGVKSYSHGIEPLSVYNEEFKKYLKIKSKQCASDELECLNILSARFDHLGRRKGSAVKGYNSAVERAHEPYGVYQTWLANYAMQASFLLFCAVTGSNLELALDTKIHTLKFEATTKHWRTSGVKARAGKKTVYPEFGLRFVPIFKKILEIREYILQGSKSEWLFSIIPKLKSQTWSRVNKGNLSARKGIARIMAFHYPDFIWITSRDFRNYKSLEINKAAEGDVEKSSSIIGHSESVHTESYLNTSVDDAAVELTSFLEKVHSIAISKSRSVDKIPVNIIESNDGKDWIPAGCCKKPNDPTIMEEFTKEAPTPDCRKYENCLFCNHYAVHADSEDVLRLLSIRYLSNILRGQGTSLEDFESRWGVVIHRVDEIIEALISKNPSLSEVIVKLKKEVETEERLDDFWSIHLDALINLGGVS